MCKNLRDSDLTRHGSGSKLITDQGRAFVFIFSRNLRNFRYTKFSLSTYYEVISTVKADIFSVEQQKPEFTSVSEFRQIETQQQILECKRNDLYKFLLWLDRRRSILGVRFYYL